MDKIEIFPWAKNFETGIDLIDEQHKKLVDILNMLAGHLANCSLPAEMNAVFDELTAYADYHFKSEEKIWRTYFKDDPWYTNHLKTHETFFGVVIGLKKEEGEKTLDKVIQEVVTFLSKWLAYHILDTDKRMAKTIQALESGKSLEEAKILANAEMSGSTRVLIDTVLNMYEGISVRTVELMREKALRKQAEQALAASEERWNFILKYILSDGEDNVWDWDIENSIQYLSGVDLPVFYVVDDTQRSFKKESMIHPDDFESVKADLQAHLAGESDFFINKHRVLRKGGQWSWVLSRGKVVSRDKNGQALRMVGTQTDITERELAALIYQNSSQGMFVTDLDNQVIGVNAAFAKLTGYATEEIIGKHPDFFFSGRHDEKFLQTIQESLTVTGHWEGEIWYQRKNGEEYPVLQTINAVVDTEGVLQYAIGLFSDMSEIYAANTERERLQRDLQQVQKIESLGQLTGGLAHDFNSLLGIMTGYSGLVLKGCENLGEARLVGYMQHVRAANKRAGNLVSQMLAFSRNDEVDDIPMQFAPLLQNDIEILRATLPFEIDIQLECEANLPSVMMNPTQLHQILMNLSLNARDAMDGAGQLRITLGWARGLDAVSSVSHKRVQGDWIELRVSDTGAGIPADLAPKVFDPYFTTKDIGKGTGLGLSVIYGIVEKHHGHILLESEMGKGSTFRILFAPLTHDQHDHGDELDEKAPPVQEIGGDGSEILVVDDELGFATFLEALLTTHGYQAQSCTDGHQALDLFQANPSRFSLLVADQCMPKITGKQLIGKVRELRPEIPAIICSAYREKEDAEEMATTPIPFFEKPLNDNRFLNAVGQLLEASGGVTK